MQKFCSRFGDTDWRPLIVKQTHSRARRVQLGNCRSLARGVLSLGRSPLRPAHRSPSRARTGGVDSNLPRVLDAADRPLSTPCWDHAG